MIFKVSNDIKFSYFYKKLNILSSIFIIFSTLKYGSPILISKIFASVDREITHPSLLDNTTTGFLIIDGLNNLSQET